MNRLNEANLLIVGIISQYLFFTTKFKNYTEEDVEMCVENIIDNNMPLNIKNIWYNDKTVNFIVIKKLVNELVSYFNLQHKHKEIYDVFYHIFKKF